jgi:hypothetical protein
MSGRITTFKEFYPYYQGEHRGGVLSRGTGESASIQSSSTNPAPCDRTAAGEHCKPLTRGLHVTGTSLFVLQAVSAALLRRPPLLLSGVWARPPAGRCCLVPVLARSRTPPLPHTQTG